MTPPPTTPARTTPGAVAAAARPARPHQREASDHAEALLPVVFTRADALAVGIGRHTQRTFVETGRWRRLRSGTFCRSSAWAQADRRDQHLLLCAAVQRRRPSAVVSHLSAAAAWGWPLPLGELPAPWVTQPSRWTPTAEPPPDASARRRPDVRVEAAALPVSDTALTERSALRVTTRPRTLADVLRHLPAPDAVAIADAAAAGGVSRAALAVVMERQDGWPYLARAVAALRLVDPRRESWLESYGTVEMCLRGVPLPESQPSVFDRRGQFVARPDTWWPDLGLVGEFDGREKYRKAGLLVPEDVERALREEKEREDRLRDLGLEVVRSTTRDVASQLDAALARWSRASRRGGAGRVSARIVPAPWPAHWPR